MASYLQLQTEPWWGLEREAPAHAELTERLRLKWNLTRSQCGSKGDNNHLRGRHRSRSWTVNSAFCTDRAYGNTDGRDKTGDGNWLRGSDIGLSGPALWAMCRRLDEAVRAGRLPCVAEWFGTFNGTTVVGWFEGHASTSDSSHLWHGHVGLWTSYCDNAEQLRLLGDILTGEDDDMPTANEIATAVWSAAWNGPSGRESAAERLSMASRGPAAVVALTPKLDAILAAALDDGDTTVVLPPEAIAELQEISAAIAALPDAVLDAEAARLAE